MKRISLVVGAMGLFALPSVASAACGDGALDSGETCDDGNTTSLDGCDSVCAIEAGYECIEANFELDFSERLATDGGSTPSWTLSSDKRTVTQSLNSDAGVYMSTLPASGVTISMDIAVNTGSDDDFNGFVIGYESGDSTATNPEWLLFDWKQGTQNNSCSTGSGAGAKGTALMLVDGPISSYRDLWCHENNVSEFARGSSYGSTGWSDNVTYTIEVTYTTSQIDIYVDGALDFSVVPSDAGIASFPTGNFGFYTLSQQSNSFTLVSPAEGLSICAELDSDGDGLTDPVEIAAGMDETSADSDGDGIDDLTE